MSSGTRVQVPLFPTLLGGFGGTGFNSFLVAVCPDYDCFIVPPPKISPHQSGLFLSHVLVVFPDSIGGICTAQLQCHS